MMDIVIVVLIVLAVLVSAVVIWAFYGLIEAAGGRVPPMPRPRPKKARDMKFIVVRKNHGR